MAGATYVFAVRAEDGAGNRETNAHSLSLTMPDLTPPAFAGATSVEAVAGEDIPSDGRRTYVRVKLAHENGQLIARTTGTQSSSAITSMVLADGLLIMPEGMTLARAGETFPVRILR